MKNPLTLAGIEPATFRFVADVCLCSSHYLTDSAMCHSHPYGPRTLSSTPLDPAARAVALAYGRTVSINIHACYDSV